MADEEMPETLETLAFRLTRLEKSVDEAFAEQRTYTEFAFGELEKKIEKQLEKQIKDVRTDMNSGFGRLERKLDRVLGVLGSGRPRGRRP